MLMSKEIWGLLVSWCFVCFIISPWQFSQEEGGGCFSLNACIVSDANGKRGESRKLKPTSIRERPSTITHFQPDFQFIICYETCATECLSMLFLSMNQGQNPPSTGRVESVSEDISARRLMAFGGNVNLSQTIRNHFHTFINSPLPLPPLFHCSW